MTMIVAQSSLVNWTQVSAELVRAARGARTQKALSRLLGYRSNVVFAWESGRDTPSASKFFELLAKTGRPPLRSLEKFARGVPSACPSTRVGAAELLRLLVGSTPQRELAAQLGRNRYAVGRWFPAATPSNAGS